MEETLKQTDSSCIKIVLFGPESSGKTTMSQTLATHYKTAWVPEYMRTYLQDKWDAKKEVCTREDLLPVSKGQMELENKMASETSNYLFCDTSLDGLVVYSKYYYDGYCPEAILEASKKNQYTLYFLAYIDTPWEKDDLRDRPNDRSALFAIFETYLQDNKLPYVILKGSIEKRLQIAIEALKNV